ncbi:MAG: hypothetical protein M3264_12925 [Thermoproteota archaeon]|nr:hypothetical protein [Thermoproteota archaeon]
MFAYKVLMALIRLCSNKSLMGLGHAGDSFNDVISKLLRTEEISRQTATATDATTRER